MRLNPGQQQAVEFVTGPCLVLAGAGSGKTRVITNKIAHLIRGCGYQARHIAAVTFTNKAAREMKERVGQTLGRKEARGLMISTFHTLGLDIIKREYAALGMKSNFSLFDDTDQVALLKELITRHRDLTGSTRAKAILDNFEEYRPKFVKVMPHEYRRALAELAAEEAARSVPEVQPAMEAVVHG